MKYPILALFILLSLSFVSAGPIQNQAYDLKVSCEGFTCSALNVTIAYPNQTTLIDNQEMTDNNYYANYSFTPNVNGEYNLYYWDGENISKDSLIVTPTGNVGNTSQMVLYLGVLVILLVFLFLCLWGGISLPFKNQRNKEDEVIKVNWRKYLKIFCWLLAYYFVLTIIFVGWNLIYAYAQWENLGLIFHFLYRLLLLFALPVLIATGIYALINYINDKKITKFIKRTGLPYNG